MPLNPQDQTKLALFAEEIRLTTLRAIAGYGEGHVGGSLSLADVLALLYGHFLRVDPADPQLPQRDKLVLSKGHCGPALYATLALKGFFPMETLRTLNRFGTSLPSHCDRNRTPGVDMSTGSLGQGASSAAGIALADRLQGRDSRTYLIVGDGECNEGQVWEMAMFAAQHKLDNLLLFVDRNRQQLDGYTDDICAMGDLAEMFGAFGWNAQTVDGHDLNAMCAAVDGALATAGKPSAIVLQTVKGKGWPRAEQRVPSHYMTISAEELREYEGISAARTATLAAANLGKAGDA